MFHRKSTAWTLFTKDLSKGSMSSQLLNLKRGQWSNKASGLYSSLSPARHDLLRQKARATWYKGARPQSFEVEVAMRAMKLPLDRSRVLYDEVRKYSFVRRDIRGRLLEVARMLRVKTPMKADVKAVEEDVIKNLRNREDRLEISKAFSRFVKEKVKDGQNEATKL
eukprot:Tbor_TRINITY_DN3230_c0_g1::TRINITY_DN3230_c0_g1_i2::g.23726::m.23726